jgi:glutathione S-transferase
MSRLIRQSIATKVIMLKLFIANRNYSSWSLRPWVLMRERKIPFEDVLKPFGENSAASGFRSFSPSGRVPCLHDGTTVVWDSLAIAEYLAERYPGVWPLDGVARAWARSAAAEMHSGFTAMRNRCSMSCGLRVRIADFSGALLQDWQRVDELWRDGLSRFGGPFLAGSAFTAADAFYAPVAFRVQTYAPPLSAEAHTYVQRLLDLDSMQAWYTAALREPWRDEAHEREVEESGTVIADLRAAVSVA